MADIGKHATIEFEGGRVIKGWIFGKLPMGLLISMDREGTDIRLVRERWTSFRSGGESVASFAPPHETDRRLRDIEDSIRSAMVGSLAALDFRPFQKAANRGAVLGRKIERQWHEHERQWHERRYYDLELDDPYFELIEYVAASTDEVLDLHREAYDELDRVQITNVIEETAGRLSEFPGELLLPIIDAKTRYEVAQLMDDMKKWREQGWTEQQHQKALANALGKRQMMIAESLAGASRRKTEAPKQRSPGSAMRYFGASLRILTGTALAAANLGAGLTAGLGSTILTIGATVVPTYVGVVTSVGTGLFQVADALEKIGGIQKDSADQR